MSHPAPACDVDCHAVITLPAGDYCAEFVWYERMGSADLEVYAAPGAWTTDSATNLWRLVGIGLTLRDCRLSYHDGAIGIGGGVTQGGPAGDYDLDGNANVFEFALGTDSTDPQSASHQGLGLNTLTVDEAGPQEFFTLTYTRPSEERGADLSGEFSTNLLNFAPGVPQSSEDLGNGTVLETWRSAEAVNAWSRGFGRIRVQIAE